MSEMLNVQPEFPGHIQAQCLQERGGMVQAAGEDHGDRRLLSPFLLGSGTKLLLMCQEGFCVVWCYYY